MAGRLGSTGTGVTGLGITGLGITVGEFLPLSARRHPDRACFLFPDGSAHSFALTNARVNRLASALRAEGVRRGDRLAVFALDSHRYMEIVLACMKLGAVYVPLNYRLRRSEADVLLRRSAPVALFHDVRYRELLDGVADEHPSLRLVIELDAPEAAGPSPYERLVSAGEDVEPPVVSTDDDLIALAFTSGTTGLPKGVLQPQRMLKAITYSGMVEYLSRSDDVRYTAAPTFHVSGVCGLFMGVAAGFTSLLLPQFEPRTVLDFLARDRVTAAFLVPTMISSILQLEGAADHSYERLRLITYGAAPISPALLRRAMDVFDCDFLQAFGAGTEAGLQTTLTPEDHRRALAERPELLRSCGRPSIGVALRIVDADMRDVPRGEVGEVATRSDQMMVGYLDMPAETERAFEGGWFRAGDMGHLDEEGYLYLHGRGTDMIIRGGENVYPVEIESVLAEHPAVAQAAVVGVPDEHWGEVVRAFVTAATGRRPAEEELLAHCRARLASYKVPREFVVLDEMPVNASGKILKRELRRWTPSSAST
ncbi:class I adenylate-forming enzyme family protein [Actinomadura geliboluensis]|uniref:class I adenylate-forming enzyme family protein n=1 Tax=Actinomadura geliboluensis TaxID=882440 RepID=UPI0037173DAC